MASTCLFVLSVLFIEASAITTCTSVEVAGAEGDISGTYEFDGSSDFVRAAGSTTYILGKYIDDEWRLGEGSTLYYALDNYPHYYSYDSNGHPVDVAEAWQLVASADNEGEAPSTFSITCAEDTTPSPTLTPTTSPPAPGTEPGTPAPQTPMTNPPGVPGSATVPVGTTSPVSEEGSSCSIDTPCPNDKCCNPDTNQCGRTPDYCQERSGKMMCCSYALQGLSSTESCFEDDVCEERRWYETAWWALASVIIIPIVYDYFTGNISKRVCG